MFHERDPRILAIHSVAGDAVMRKSFFALGNRGSGDGLRILFRLVPHQDVQLGVGHDPRLDSAGLIRLASGEHENGREPSDKNMGAHGHSTTRIVSVCLLYTSDAADDLL